MSGSGARDSDIMPGVPTTRRSFLQASGLTAAAGSAALIAACGEEEGASPEDDANDAKIVNEARALEFAAAANYKAALPFLEGPVRAIAEKFAAQEQTQADGFARVVTDLGGVPVEPKGDFSGALEFLSGAIGEIKNQSGALLHLISVEAISITVYVGSVADLVNTDLRATFTSLAAHASEQQAVLLGAQGDSGPAHQAPSPLAKGAKLK